MIQNLAWTVSLVLMAAVAIVFAVVCAGASARGTLERPYHGRAWVFGVLLLAGVGIAVFTMSPWPQLAYAAAAQSAKPAMTVQVTGHQWRWELSANEVPVGKPVEFLVTASDVNHGFAIYKAKQRMLAEVQAMPGFTNRLIVTFPEPGPYELLCLEYCGLAHHNMMATITAR